MRECGPCARGESRQHHELCGGIFAFEHRTLSQSPIENALKLVDALPVGAHISLVSHSRGGLVADLLCLGDFDALIDGYAYPFEGTGDADADEAKRVIGELETAHAGQRTLLRQLAQRLRERQVVVQRYVRTASPASFTARSQISMQRSIRSSTIAS